MIRVLTYRPLSRFELLVAASSLLSSTGIALAQSLKTSTKGQVLATSAVEIGRSNCEVVLHILRKAKANRVLEAEAKMMCRAQVLSSVHFKPIDTSALENGFYPYTITGELMGKKASAAG